MKTIAICLLVVGALGLTGCAGWDRAPVAAGKGGQVQVMFEHPEQFTDAKTQSSGPTDPHVLDELRDTLVHAASPRIPAGATLTITFADVDLAGAYEPWHITATDVRMVRPVYPPRLRFTWNLKDPSGAVERQGTEDLLDTSFQSRMNPGGNPLFYEKDMLETWVRRTFS